MVNRRCGQCVLEPTLYELHSVDPRVQTCRRRILPRQQIPKGTGSQINLSPNPNLPSAMALASLEAVASQTYRSLTSSTSRTCERIRIQAPPRQTPVSMRSPKTFSSSTVSTHDNVYQSAFALHRISNARPVLTDLTGCGVKRPNLENLVATLIHPPDEGLLDDSHIVFWLNLFATALGIHMSRQGTLLKDRGSGFGPWILRGF